jgi:signal transduction histidine kinase
MVTVADNGEGIADDLQKKIFDPFFTTREVGTGMGLGLSIVERIIRGFSGYIEVESVPGKGACFSVYIPQYREAMTAIDQGRPQREGSV